MAGVDNLKEQQEKMKQGLASELGTIGGSNKAGSKHLSTIIREIGENIDWDKTTLKNKAQMKELYGNNAWSAIVYVATTQAIAGDDKARKWLAENGFGKQLDITSGGEKINPYAQLSAEELRKLAE